MDEFQYAQTSGATSIFTHTRGPSVTRMWDFYSMIPKKYNMLGKSRFFLVRLKKNPADKLLNKTAQRNTLCAVTGSVKE